MRKGGRGREGVNATTHVYVQMYMYMYTVGRSLSLYIIAFPLFSHAFSSSILFSYLHFIHNGSKWIIVPIINNEQF